MHTKHLIRLNSTLEIARNIAVFAMIVCPIVLPIFWYTQTPPTQDILFYTKLYAASVAVSYLLGFYFTWKEYKRFKVLNYKYMLFSLIPWVFTPLIFGDSIQGGWLSRTLQNNAILIPSLALLLISWIKTRLSKPLERHLKDTLHMPHDQNHTTYKNRTIHLNTRDTIKVKDKGNFTYIQTQSPHTLPLSIFPKKQRTSLTPPCPPTPTGDLDFDHLYTVHADTPETIHAYVTPELRSAILQNYNPETLFFLHENTALWTTNDVLIDPTKAPHILDQHARILDILEEQHRTLHDQQLLQSAHPEEHSQNIQKHAYHNA